MLRAGRRRATQPGTPWEECHHYLKSWQKREAAEGVRDGREVGRVLTDITVGQVGGRGSTCTIKVGGRQAMSGLP